MEKVAGVKVPAQLRMGAKAEVKGKAESVRSAHKALVINLVLLPLLKAKAAV